MINQYEIATLGGGCFWCLEAIYQDVRGVERVVSGYTGGMVANPSYREVCTGTTGHAEVVQVVFDPQVISFTEILDIFWRIHDPTTLNRQGADVGTQYRSAVFYHNDLQKEVAERSKQEAASLWTAPIVTEVVPLGEFYAAEDYHQNYFNENPYQPYCQIVVDPKVKKFKKAFAAKLK